ncbi:hypothetical protein WJX73_010726 [Symbiochloris irregularis]|uniref:Uncharacterized protein n=1 Tax=Symbiochloris irregularis TaxID=706552 RepID=A0AAW1NU58_9CHLO
MEEQLLQADMALQSLTQLVGRQRQLLEKMQTPKHDPGKGFSAAVQSSVATARDLGALQLYQPQLSRTLAQKQRSWADHMDLLAAVQMDDEVTAAITLPDNSALARYIALGDASGKIYVFSPMGKLQAEVWTGTQSGVSSLTWHRHNATAFVLASAHEDGSLRLTGMHQHIERAPGLPEQADITGWQTQAPATQQSGGSLEDGLDDVTGPAEHLLSFKLSPSGFHHYLAVIGDRRAVLWGPRGNKLAQEDLQHEVVAARPSSKGVLFTSQGLAVFRYGRLGRQHADSDADEEKLPLFQHHECAGLNGSIVVAATWGAESHESLTAPRVFALTSGGDLLTVSVGPESMGPCKVRHRKPLGGNAVPAELAAMHGYLMLTTPSAVAIFNITGAVFSSGPRLVAADHLSTVAAVIGIQSQQDEELEVPPVLATSTHKLVVVDLGRGRAAFFESLLPVREKAAPRQLEYWMRPLFIVVVVGVAYWQFTRARGKKDYYDMREAELRSGSRGPYSRESAQPRNEALMAKALMAERHQADAWLRGNDPTGLNSNLINRRGAEYDGELKSIVQPLFERDAGREDAPAQDMRTAEGFPLRQNQPEGDLQSRLRDNVPPAGGSFQ